MEVKVDEDLTIDEDVIIEDNSIEEEEVIEESETTEEEPESIPDEDDEEDRVVTIGDSVAEDESEETEDKPETPGWVKKVRKVNRKLESENKRLKRQLEENERAAEKIEPVELGKEPTLAGCKYDDVVYKQELRAYDNRAREVEKQVADKAETVEAQNKVWQNRQEQYVNLKQEHGFKDFGEAEELVSDTFSVTQQGIIVQGAEDAALLVYALGKNPKKLEELSKISDPVDFAFKVAKLESQLKVTSRKAPRVKTGKSGGVSGSSDKTLARLRDEAAKSGDYTKVTSYKQKLRKG